MPALVEMLDLIYRITTMVLEQLMSGGLEYLDLDYEKLSLSLGPCLLDLYEPCSSNKILFYLYTRKTEDLPVLLNVSDNQPPVSYNSAADTKVLIHGYAGSAEFNQTVLLRRAYLQRGDYNIIVVDWGKLVRIPCYPTAVLNTWQAGKCVAQMLANLSRLLPRSFDLSKVHVIGFSLGAHVAGYASDALWRRLGRRFDRITGLDPALPFFATLKPSWKLDRGDAEFVDIVHTNCGVFGKIEASGHVDFYVNGGFSQPACANSTNRPLCSHLMAPVYFAESILKSRGFWGSPCVSYWQYVLGGCPTVHPADKALMGDNVSRSSRGVFFVETAKTSPFALG